MARSTGVCAGSGRAFVPGERVVAVLVEGTNAQPGNLLARVDFSVEAWNEGARPSGPVFGVWRTAFTPGEVKKKSLLSDEELLDLFEELGAATEAKQIGFRYLLTLLQPDSRREARAGLYFPAILHFDEIMPELEDLDV